MPGKSGFCWCLGGTAPPEISYGIENGGMTLKPIEVDIPMPQDDEELNAMFAELVVSQPLLLCGLDQFHLDYQMTPICLTWENGRGWNLPHLSQISYGDL